MAKNYHGYGDKLNVGANKITAAVTAGDLVQLGSLYGVALNDGEANEKNTLQLEGEFTLAKATGAGTGGAQGVKANATGANLITAGAGSLVGVFVEDAADGDATAKVKLLGNVTA